MAGHAMGETANRNERKIRVGGARTYRGQHRYDGDLGGTSGFPVKLGLHTIPTLDPLMNHIPSGRLAPPTVIRYSSDICQSSIGAFTHARETGRTGERCVTRSSENLESSPVLPFPQVSLALRTIPHYAWPPSSASSNSSMSCSSSSSSSGRMF